MSEYTDVNGNTHEITNSTLTAEEREQAEDEIVEQLFQIFTRK